VEIKFGIWKNSRNQQLTLSIPKTAFPQLKGKSPKYVKFKGDLEFFE
jgi:hypothetical protein